MKIERIWQDLQLVGSACGGALLPVPTARCPPFVLPMTPNHPYHALTGDHRRPTKGPDQRPLPVVCVADISLTPSFSVLTPCVCQVG